MSALRNSYVGMAVAMSALEVNNISWNRPKVDWSTVCAWLQSRPLYSGVTQSKASNFLSN